MKLHEGWDIMCFVHKCIIVTTRIGSQKSTGHYLFVCEKILYTHAYVKGPCRSILNDKIVIWKECREFGGLVGKMVNEILLLVRTKVMLFVSGGILSMW